MSQDLRFYSSFAVLSGSANYVMGLLAAPSSINLPVLGGVYGVSKAVALKGMNLFPLENRENKLLLLATSISSWLFASTCVFAVGKILNLPLNFTAALITGVTFEFFGGGIFAVFCVAIAVGTIALHKLGIIDCVSVKEALSKWTSDKEGNTVLGYVFMNALIQS